MGTVKIHPDDNVVVSLDDGHKYADRDIKCGEKIIKYGFPIGVAVRDAKHGSRIHSDEMKTLLSGVREYKYSPAACVQASAEPPMINAYIRKNGDVGIRNDIWIINTVGCINKTAERIARETGAFAFTHPYGCSQLGGDFERTAKLLCGLIKHPNAGGVLVLGLGCENTNIDVIKKMLGCYDGERLRFLNLQECDDEIETAKKIIGELRKIAEADKRVGVPASRLRIGMKCGGSDGLSGITANALVGRITDRVVSFGGSAALTEVPEMFGAEQILFSRCRDEEIFNKAVKLINDYKKYFIENGQPVSENPSPGNKAGGITTLEEKSLGCVQKGGKATITDVITYGETITKSGLTLLDGPGNDMVAVTNLTAAGCHMILFTTGRGTPLGAPVPTVKISTNTELYRKKPSWIDFDAGTMLADGGAEESLFRLVLDTANGRPTNNEINGYREIAIFKDGVTL